MNRAEARCEAFKLVFQITAHKDSYPDVVDYFKQENQSLLKTDKKQYNYIVSVANGVYENKETIDKTISDNLKDGWKIERISKVSLAILRLALYEILYVDDIPNKVSVNEAIELAKLYDTDDGPGFINGALSGLLK